MYEIPKTKDNVRFLIISDLHLGNIGEGMDLLYQAYEYALKNNIKYVINLGDLIDAVMPHNSNDLKINDVTKQVEYVIDNYPCVNSIKTMILYGNHDYYSKHIFGFDVGKEISSGRKDLYDLGYGENYVRILDNFIKLGHEIDYYKGYKQNIETFLSFLGHYHRYKVRVVDDSIYVHAPSLSSVTVGGDKVVPALLDVNLSFHNDRIEKVSLKQIDLSQQSVLSDMQISVPFANQKFMKVKKYFDS